MLIELDKLKALIAKYAPVFYLHPDDKYMPCSAEYYMSHSELRSSSKYYCGGSTVLLKEGEVTSDTLLACQYSHQKQPGGNDGDLYLALNPSARCGMPPDHIDHKVPLYVHPKSIITTSPDKEGSAVAEALELTYITFYAYNGPYYVGGLIKTGHHDADWEHLTVRVHPVSGSLLGVWYNAHRPRDGEWSVGQKVPIDEVTGRIKAYVALHGHGTYPRKGIIHRHFYLGNDHTSDRGKVWRPNKMVLLPCIDNDKGGNNNKGIDNNSIDNVMIDTDEARIGKDVTDVNGTTANGTTANGMNDGSSHRMLIHCHSRGDCLMKKMDASKLQSDSISNASDHQVEVVDDDICGWLRFRGTWGSVDGPAQQGWFNRAEHPISRSKNLRIFGHFYPETERI